jgi:hypothetical protein
VRVGRGGVGDDRQAPAVLAVLSWVSLCTDLFHYLSPWEGESFNLCVRVLGGGGGGGLAVR